MESSAEPPLRLSFLADYRPAKHRVSPSRPSKKQVHLAPQPCKMDLLTVPVVDTQTEARPLTLEEMEEVGKRYRERRRQHKVPGQREGHGAWPLDRLVFKSTAPSSWGTPGSRLFTPVFPPLILRTTPASQGSSKDVMRSCFQK